MTPEEAARSMAESFDFNCRRVAEHFIEVALLMRDKVTAEPPCPRCAKGEKEDMTDLITRSDDERLKVSDTPMLTGRELFLCDSLRAALERAEAAEADEKWMREHFVDLIFRADGAVSLHAAGIIGRVIESTIHTAIEAAKKESQWQEMSR